MINLIEMVQACRRAKAPHVRLRFAEDIIFQVGPALRNFIQRHAHSNHVDDAYQETLLAIVLTVDRCRATTGLQFWSWCYRIAARKAADQCRGAKIGVNFSLDHEENLQAVEAMNREETISHEERDELEYAFALLQEAKPPCVGYLWDRIALDLSYKEVAKLYGLNEDTARMRVKRCLKLAKALVSQKAKATHV